MADAFLDTSVVIDLLRGYEPAKQWFAAQNNLALSRVVWLEVLEGAPNRAAQRAALQFLHRLPVEEVKPDDVVWATEQMILRSLSHNVDACDAIIASSCHRLQIPLFTRNFKHFEPLVGSLARRPY